MSKAKKKGYNVTFTYELRETIHVLATSEEQAKELAFNELKWSPSANLFGHEVTDVEEADE